MTLESVKLKIDNHFETISPEELYKKLTEEYGMKDMTSMTSRLRKNSSFVG